MMDKRIAVLTCAALGLAMFTGCAGQSKAKKYKSQLDKIQKKRKKLEKQNNQYKSKISELEDKMAQAEELADERQMLYSEIQDDLKSLLEAGRAEITFRRGLMIVQMPNDVLFQSGEFGLRDKGEKALSKVASALGDLEDRRILVAGHTDDVPVSKKAENYDSNMELSTKRALAAADILAQNGMPESDLGALGFGPNDPIMSNDSNKAREENRRVELVLLPNMTNLLQPIKQAMQKQSSGDDQS